MSPRTGRPLVAKLTAEAIGTFAIAFVAVLAMAHGPFGGTSLVGAALANGFIVAAMASAFMLVSGGQFNPAVTLALWLARQMGGRDTLAFVATQFAAGLAGGLAARLVVGPDIAAGVPAMADGVTVAAALLVEAVLTFFLVVVIFGTAVDQPFGARLGGLAIGLTVAVGILAGGPLTGAAMNPARWFGPALLEGGLSGSALAVYLGGPTLGGLLGALVYSRVVRPDLPRARLDG
jgi:glycerol uptake facilitator-like aquaporin